MADCKYSTRQEKDNIGHKIQCKATNDLCGFCYFCHITNDYKNRDNYKICQIYKKKENEMAKSSDTPNKVVFEKRGKLAIELNDEIGQVCMFDNPFDYVPKYVKLLKRANGEYYIKK